jgi:hypothetical protein
LEGSPRQIVCGTLSQKTHHKKKKEKKRAGGVAEGVGPEFKPQYCKKIKEKKKFSAGQVGLSSSQHYHYSRQDTKRKRRGFFSPQETLVLDF